MPDSTSGRLQDLRSFTVQIRTPAMDSIVGTGIAVSNGGLIATCAHVVQAALGLRRRVQPGDTVGVYFPQARGDERKQRHGLVSQVLLEEEDDVVLLKLPDGLPLAPEQIAILGSADLSEGNDFRSYGYQRLDKYQAGRASGKILGKVEGPPGIRLRLDPIELESNQINRGMSGAAVLDVQRNLVVGLISETYYADKSLKNVGTAWAVDGGVLSLEPLSVPLNPADLPRRPIRYTALGSADDAGFAPAADKAFHGAPSLLKEWIGREPWLAALDADWNDKNIRVVGIIGFGGDGKSSLVRKWIDNLEKAPSPPSAIFWWSFDAEPNPDAFFEAALSFVAGGRIEPGKHNSSNRRAHLVVDALILLRQRIVFALDGFEVMQHAEGDAFGTIRSNDLREFLQLFADTDHPSLCVVTSRLPLLDMLALPACQQRDMERLSPVEGRALLRALGVRGAEAELDELVEEWDGHALTLNLLGSYLVEKHGGEVTRLTNLPRPTSGDTRYDRIQQVLQRYDQYLTNSHQTFLKIFSAFRAPVSEVTFRQVFRARAKGAGAEQDLRLTGSKAAFDKLVKQLLAYRLLRLDAATKQYTTHPLVRAHYWAKLNQSEPQRVQPLHARIAAYYLKRVGALADDATLDQLKTMVEAVHHSCCAGQYDQAFNLAHKPQILLRHQYGAYDMTLAMMKDFFPSGDVSLEPHGSEAQPKNIVLQIAGVCLMNLGGLAEAIPLFVRANAIAAQTADWLNATTGYQSLAKLHAYLGELEASLEACQQALELARPYPSFHARWNQNLALALMGWVTYLRGDVQESETAFHQAEMIQQQELAQQTDWKAEYLYGEAGIRYADLLRRQGQATRARAMLEFNREFCTQNNQLADLSRCHRSLGDLESSLDAYPAAREHYDLALTSVRRTSDRAALIEALLGRGSFLARFAGEPAAARSDLDEALDYAVQGRYRILECDIRVALAWAHLSAGEPSLAYDQANSAKLIADNGYYWGQLGVAEILDAIESGSQTANIR